MLFHLRPEESGVLDRGSGRVRKGRLGVEAGLVVWILAICIYSDIFYIVCMAAFYLCIYERHITESERAWTLEPDYLGLNAGAAIS